MYNGLSRNTALHAASGCQKFGGRRRGNVTGRRHSFVQNELSGVSIPGISISFASFSSNTNNIPDKKVVLRTEIMIRLFLTGRFLLT